MGKSGHGENFEVRLDDFAGKIYLDFKQLERKKAERDAKEGEMHVKGTFDKTISDYLEEISRNLGRLDQLVGEIDASPMGNGHGQKEKLYRSAIDIYMLAPR